MYSILIADDEPIERVVLTKMIQKYYQDQFSIVQAVNGREASSLFEENKCRIAILDIEMPGIDGLTAAEEIRKKHKDCCIIFLTAFDEFSYAKRAIYVKALDYLLKPCPDRELRAALDEAVRILQEEDAATEQQKEKQRDEEKEEGRQEVLQSESSRMEITKANIAKEMILDYIHHHYWEDISLQDVAGALHYSDAYFCRLFRQCFDNNFTAYMADYRVEKAKELLSNPVISVNEAGEKSGYRDANYFTKVFKRVTGFTPSEYRLQILKLPVD